MNNTIIILHYFVKYKSTGTIIYYVDAIIKYIIKYILKLTYIHSNHMNFLILHTNNLNIVLNIK